MLRNLQKMQSWDRHQSIISGIGAAAFFLVAFIVIRGLELSYVFFLLAILGACGFYLANMRRFILRRYWLRTPFPRHFKTILTERVPYYRRLSEKEKHRFEQAITIFLNENRITGIGTRVDDQTRLLVASSAVMLLFGRPEWEYKTLPEILIYPRSFAEDYEFTTYRADRIIAGIVVPQNGIVFSKQDLMRAFGDPEDHAYHVGLHEFAHALDLTDGVAEGIPGYLRAGKVKEWYELIRDELKNVRRGRSVLNRYAGTNKAELFAVAVEHFFQRPDELKEQHPRLYEALASFLNQNPAEYVY